MPGYELLTSSLRLHLIDERDRALYRALYTCSQVMAEIGPALSIEAADAALDRVSRHNRLHAPGHRQWCITERATSERLGLVALRREGAHAELGMMLLPAAWNGRHSRAALAVVLRHAFESIGLEQVEVRCRDGRNTRVLRRLATPFGFERTTAPAGSARWSVPKSHWRDVPADTF